MILRIDNYDSFVYNLYQLIGSITPDLKVIRNDASLWPEQGRGAEMHRRMKLLSGSFCQMKKSWRNTTCWWISAETI